MITKERLREMFALQELLEKRIDGDDWRDKNHNYRLCIFMECAEIIDCTAWKHWKDVDAEPDFDAIAMELVDVWHFAMAFLLMHEDFEADNVFKAIEQAMAEYDDNADRSIEQLAIGLGYAGYATGTFPFGNFYGLMVYIDMDWEMLYRLYISKNVLNWFRQEHGYKDGTYLKNWGGAEDNEHLQELMIELGDDLDAGKLHEALTLRYSLVVK